MKIKNLLILGLGALFLLPACDGPANGENDDDGPGGETTAEGILKGISMEVDGTKRDINFTLDDQNRLTGIADLFGYTFKYEADKVIVELIGNREVDGEPLADSRVFITQTYTLENGRAVSCVTTDKDPDGELLATETTTFSYDSNGRMTGFVNIETYDDDDDTEKYTHAFEWEGGNKVKETVTHEYKMHMSDGSRPTQTEVQVFIYEYKNSAALNKFTNIDSSNFFWGREIIAEMLCIGGARCKLLPTRIAEVPAENYGYYEETLFTYTVAEDGYVSKMTTEQIEWEKDWDTGQYSKGDINGFECGFIYE